VRRRGRLPRTHTLVIDELRHPDPAALRRRIIQALRDGVEHIAIDLSGAGHVDDRACRAIRDVFTTIQEHQSPGARAKLVLAGVSDHQLELLKAARLTNCIPVERRMTTPAPLALTSEIPL